MAVLDGPDAGKQTTADASGRYALAGLRQAGFSVRATANGYAPVTIAVTLTADTVTDFRLPRITAAVLTGEGSLTYETRADGSRWMKATGVNTGDGCASSIAGSSTLRNVGAGVTLTFDWALPPATVVRPGERFTYTFGPITNEQLAGFPDGSTYTSSFRFSSAPCS